jgi:hypothetical protein
MQNQDTVFQQVWSVAVVVVAVVVVAAVVVGVTVMDFSHVMLQF